MTGAQLKRWREKLGWTQAEAAAWWPCDKRTWQRHEASPRIPPEIARRVRDPFYDSAHIVGGKRPEVPA